MKLVLPLLFLAFATLQAETVKVAFNLLCERLPKEKIEIVFQGHFDRSPPKEIARKELSIGLNEIEFESSVNEEDISFDIISAEFSEVSNWLDALKDEVIETQFLFLKRKLLVEYVVSENGTAFGDEADLQKEEWIAHGARLPVMGEDFRITQVANMFTVNYHRPRNGFGLHPTDYSDQDFDAIKESPPSGYEYKNPILEVGKPLVFKIYGHPERSETYVKIIAKEMKLEPAGTGQPM